MKGCSLLQTTRVLGASDSPVPSGVLNLVEHSYECSRESISTPISFYSEPSFLNTGFFFSLPVPSRNDQEPEPTHAARDHEWPRMKKSGRLSDTSFQWRHAEPLAGKCQKCCYSQMLHRLFILFRLFVQTFTKKKLDIETRFFCRL